MPGIEWLRQVPPDGTSPSAHPFRGAVTPEVYLNSDRISQQRNGTEASGRALGKDERCLGDSIHAFLDQRAPTGSLDTSWWRQEPPPCGQRRWSRAHRVVSVIMALYIQLRRAARPTLMIDRWNRCPSGFVRQSTPNLRFAAQPSGGNALLLLFSCALTVSTAKGSAQLLDQSWMARARPLEVETLLNSGADLTGLDERVRNSRKTPCERLERLWCGMKASLAGGVMSAQREQPIAGRLDWLGRNSAALRPDGATRWLESGGSMTAAAPHKCSPPPVSLPGPEGVVPDAPARDSVPELALDAGANSGGLAIARLPLVRGIKANVESQGGPVPTLRSVRRGNLRPVAARSASINGTLVGTHAGDLPQSVAGVRQVAAQESCGGGQGSSSIRFKVSCGAGSE